jgi:N-acetylglucosamine kinase-like BadF-type ATPase
MCSYFLGIDIGGSKSHALIADEAGQAVGFGKAGAGSWEAVGYPILTEVLQSITSQALDMAGLTAGQVTGAGMGIAGYDWPSQLPAHMEAISTLGLHCPIEVVNDAMIGILAAAEGCWGVSVVAGTGTNCWGRTRQPPRIARMVGGGGHWSGEPSGSVGLVLEAMRAVTFEWNKRGPATALTPVFMQHFGVSTLDELVEKVHLSRHRFQPKDVLMVFQVASQGDIQALEAIAHMGCGLGEMAWGVINQLEIKDLTFDVVMIGSLWNGHPLLAQKFGETVNRHAPHARMVRLTVPPVVGGVLLGMEAAGWDPLPVRPRLLDSIKEFL